MTTTIDRPNAIEEPAPTGPEPWFARLARFSAGHRRWVMAIWLVTTLAAAPLALTLTGALSGAGWDAQGSTAQVVREELRRDFPELGAEAAVVVYRQTTPLAQDPAGLQRVVADLQGTAGTAAVIDPLGLPPEAGLLSPDGITALIPVQLAGTEDADLPESAGQLIETVERAVVARGRRGERDR